MSGRDPERVMSGTVLIVLGLAFSAYSSLNSGRGTWSAMIQFALDYTVVYWGVWLVLRKGNQSHNA